MSISEKLILITENLKTMADMIGQGGGSFTDWDDAYNQGYSEGWDSGYWQGYDEGYMAASGSMGGEEEGVEYTCPNCGTWFRTDGTPYCPECGANHDEWYENMPSFTCPNCGEIVYTEGPPDCPHCGTNADEWYEENYDSYGCQNCGEYFSVEKGEPPVCPNCGHQQE